MPVRRWWMAVLSVVASAVVVAPSPAVADAAAGGAGESPEAVVGFVASASASGMRFTYRVPGEFVVETIFDFGGPVAESRLDLNGGVGYASLPFPGETAIVAPALSNVVGLPVVPVTYPFYVSTQYPASEKASMADPSGHYGLDSESGEASSTSVAFFRGGPEDHHLGAGSAHTVVKREAAGLSARAESVSEALSLGGGMLRIGSVTSRSVTTLQAGTLKRSTELVVNGLEVGGTPAGVGPDGVDDEALNQALGVLGISVRVVKGTEEEHGASADALVVRFVHPIPGSTSTGIAEWR
ncbi:MAG: hypothetical protein ACRD0O_13005, partial [Acidimicrobiia bacterium]